MRSLLFALALILLSAVEGWAEAQMHIYKTAKYFTDDSVLPTDQVAGYGFNLDAADFGDSPLSFNLRFQQGGFLVEHRSGEIQFTDFNVGLTLEAARQQVVNPFISFGWALSAWQDDSVEEEENTANGVYLRAGSYLRFGSWLELLMDARYSIMSELDLDSIDVRGDVLELSLGLGLYLH